MEITVVVSGQTATVAGPSELVKSYFRIGFEKMLVVRQKNTNAGEWIITKGNGLKWTDERLSMVISWCNTDMYVLSQGG